MEQTGKKLIIGALAHVDAGKTTLSEAMLYVSGRLRRLGRVDHGDAFLDTDVQERERGITIFSKQAEFQWKDTSFTLLDTPGHVDFSSEMERTLGVLDCAILVVSGTDGVQSHTVTLWQLLTRYNIPTFIFINKMDLAGADRASLMSELKSRFGDGCVDLEAEDVMEQIAMCGENALSCFLESGTVPDDEISSLIGKRALFPCCFGSGLKLDGVEELLDTVSRYAPTPAYPDKFSARVYKIARDGQGTRLTYMKITGGTLKVKSLLTNRGEKTAEENIWEEKVNQIRIYSGDKFTTEDEVPSGYVCAVTGLSSTFSGECLGEDAESSAPVLEPVFTYQVIPSEDCDIHTVLQKLRQLEEEDPQLHVVWNETLREIHVQLMGEVQLEILKRLCADRFGMDISFGEGSILYRETILEPVEGVGHYEPLRHYAEVHLLLEPGERGSGLHFYTACSEDELDRNWQRLIMTHLLEKEHVGVLTGSPITDMKITLIAGRAHIKHTEGGDFRQATYRAVRHGLMCAKSVLLEPWYDVRLEIPPECVGRAMTDIQRMGGTAEISETNGNGTVLEGTAPVAEMRQYAKELTSYTRGQGHIYCSLRGYEPCRDQDAVVAETGYDSERDTENSADSVFCSHGAGVLVNWREVRDHMHIDTGLKLGREDGPQEREPERVSRASYAGMSVQDKELQAIFERTYGQTKDRAFRPQTPKAESASQTAVQIKPPVDAGPEYLLVDGYNIIFAWDELKSAAAENLDAARQMLMDMLSNYQGYRKCVVILVFDAYKVQRSHEDVIKYHNISVVYTKEAETADTYIEKASYQIAKKYRVRVATSDNMEQLIILGNGAMRISASAFREEVEEVAGQIKDILRRSRQTGGSRAIRDAMEQAEKNGQKQ